MNRKRKTLAALLAIYLSLGMAASAQQERPPAPPKTGDDAPDFTLKTHDGRSLTLSRLKGQRGVVLVFFATWCEPCMAEVPHVKDFVEATRDKNILVYGVNIDQPLDVVKRFVEDKKVNYRILLDEKGAVAQRYGVYGIPHVTAIDADGVVRYIGHGLPRGKARDALVEILTAPLKDKNGSGAGTEN